MKTLIRIFLETAINNAQQTGRRSWRQLRNGSRFLVQDRGHGFRGRGLVKRLLSGDELIQDGAEREDVGAMVNIFRAHLLGRHVTDSSHHRASLGALGKRRFRTRSVFALANLGKAEVQNLHPPLIGEKQVFRLQIAMDDPFFMRRRQAVRDLNGIVDRLAQRHRTAS